MVSIIRIIILKGWKFKIMMSAFNKSFHAVSHVKGQVNPLKMSKCTEENWSKTIIFILKQY